MPTFTYKATDVNGKLMEGTIEGKDERSVISRLQEQQYFPLKVERSAEKKGISREFSVKSFLQRVKRQDVVTFTQQLATLTDAGLQLDRSLMILAELNEGNKFQGIIQRIRKNVQGGSMFGDALSKHPKLFNRLYINMVRSGEAGGVLDVILIRLAGFLETAQQLRNDIISALIYPLLLIMVGASALAILLTFVIPKFAMIFEEMGTTLPWMTQLVITVSETIAEYWYFVLGGIVFLYLILRSYRKTDKGRYKLDELKLKVPLLGDLFHKIEIARFARTLGTLTRSGVPILQALAIVKDTLTNDVIAKALLKVYGDIKEGEGIADPLAQTKVFPPLAVHMIRVGEETGQLENMLIKVADSYENEVKVTTSRIMSLLEPALILFMGLLIGFVVISMLLAIFSISTDVGM